MTIKPKWKIEINGINASEYIIGDNSLLLSSINPITQGTIYVDNNFPQTLKLFQKIDFYLNVDSDIKLFSGLITNIKEIKDNFLFALTISTHAYRTMKLTATNKFREDMGNGNAKTIATSLLDEYLPEYSYDNTSIPDTTYVFLEQTYQNKRLNEIFDFMAETLDRRWWVNENIKFILCDRNFSLVDAAINALRDSGFLADSVKRSGVDGLAVAPAEAETANPAK